MDRWTALDRLNDVWPGKFAPGRIAVYEKALSRYSEEGLEVAIEQVMLECQYPPPVADIASRAGVFDRREARKRDGPKKYKPGDQVPGRPEGERFMTVEQALDEIDRFSKENPEASQPPQPDETTMDRHEKLKRAINRMYVSALQNCVHNNGAALPEATQRGLF